MPLLHLLDVAKHLHGFFYRRNVGYMHESATAQLLQIAAPRVVTYIVYYLFEGLALVIGTIGIGHKLHVHSALAQHYLLEAEPLAEPAQCHNLHKFLAFGRYRAKTVDEPTAVS